MHILITLLDAAATTKDSTVKAAAETGEKIAAESAPLIDMLFKGGGIMILLALCLIAAIFFIFERFMYISGRAKIDPNVLNVVKDNLKENRPDAALSYCERTPTTQAQVIATGMRFLGSNMREIESAMETRANVELSAMESNLNYLSLISRIAPMIGFVGTIWGVITIFYTISVKGNLEIGGISEGLYIKMVTSLAGLVVGIISFIGYQLLQRKIDKFAERIQEQSLGFLELLNKSNL
ncbi:MAG: MotA/TolQ/ExbB proton channel family protein [Bacteroidetes bacterium]|nr:MotA/TolQ/ExbB proton channel family protein [Bacteroidota bacterium]